jgi:hypothetical protein
MGEERNVVIRLQAYRFALLPDEEQRRLKGRFAGSCRFVFNRALDLQNEVFKLCGFHPGMPISAQSWSTGKQILRLPG